MSDKGRRGGLADPILNKGLDLLTSDMASARNVINCALWPETRKDAVQRKDMLLGIPLQCCMQMLIL